jgi:hypothetical protein
VDIDLISRKDVKSYSFIIADPDFKADHKEVDFEGFMPPKIPSTSKPTMNYVGRSKNSPAAPAMQMGMNSVIPSIWSSWEN